VPTRTQPSYHPAVRWWIMMLQGCKCYDGRLSLLLLSSNYRPTHQMCGSFIYSLALNHGSKKPKNASDSVLTPRPLTQTTSQTMAALWSETQLLSQAPKPQWVWYSPKTHPSTIFDLRWSILIFFWICGWDGFYWLHVLVPKAAVSGLPGSLFLRTWCSGSVCFFCYCLTCNCRK
jgi:hypothetical protein